MGRVELVCERDERQQTAIHKQSISALHSYVLLTQTAAAFQTREDEHRVVMTAEIQLITFFTV